MQDSGADLYEQIVNPTSRSDNRISSRESGDWRGSFAPHRDMWGTLREFQNKLLPMTRRNPAIRQNRIVRVT